MNAAPDPPLNVLGGLFSIDSHLGQKQMALLAELAPSQSSLRGVAADRSGEGGGSVEVAAVRGGDRTPSGLGSLEIDAGGGSVRVDEMGWAEALKLRLKRNK